MIDPRHTECADIKNVRHVQWNEVRSNDWEQQTILLARTDLAILNSILMHKIGVLASKSIT